MIEIDGVSKMYKLYRQPGDRLRDAITMGRSHSYQEHWALRDVSLQIEKGETFCIVGENGSGKTTLLKLIVGILEPTSGTVQVRGRLTALLALGAGFNPEFSGRQNLFLNGAILGLAPREVEECLEQILDFAEIGAYIDQPVKTYSSGMTVRLGFALAVHLHPEILVVDEALAVGDIYFRHRCMRKIHELRARGVTVVYVTHDVSEIKELGHRALWLESGRIREVGDVRGIAQRYLAALLEKDTRRWKRQQAVLVQQHRVPDAPPEIITGLSRETRRFGDGRGEVLGVALVDPRGRALEQVLTPADIVVRVSVRAAQPIEWPIIGILIRTDQGVDLSATNTAHLNIPVAPMVPGETRTFDFHLRLPELAPALYRFIAAVADGELAEYRLCDWAENAVSLRVLPGEKPVCGYLRLPCLVSAHTVSRAG
jgi:ABC-type polysaccharide/polyol phosphate transport system ATPase subunit